MIYTLDKKLRVTFSAGKENSKLELDSAQYLNKTPQELVETMGLDPDVASKMTYHYEQALRGKPQYYETAYAGFYYSSWAVPLTDNENDDDKLLIVSQNITQSKKDQEKINAQRRFLNKLFHTLPSMLYVFDRTKGKVTYINEKVFDFAGYTIEEVEGMGRDILSLVHPDDLEEVKQKLKDIHLK